MKLPDILSSPDVKIRVREALAEDMGPKKLDVTSFVLIPSDEMVTAHLIARENAILSGGTIAAEVFRQIDSALQIVQIAAEGTAVKSNDIVLSIFGSARSILIAERTALNFIQRMTGIATLTHQYVEEANPETLILDTRKTTPTLRTLEKYAVACGGGTNHRYGLFDRILIKDNHLVHWIRQGKTIADAIYKARAQYPDMIIEVEVDTINQLQEILTARPDWVLLDNMSSLQLLECVKQCEGICKTEASGGITLSTIREIAKTGVDAISVGLLTHSAPSADLALDLV